MYTGFSVHFPTTLTREDNASAIAANDDLTANSFLAEVTGLRADPTAWTVWTVAREFLFQYMAEYGNQLAPIHRRALSALLAMYVGVARGRQGSSPLRYAVAMPTGTGKTQSAVAFIAAIVHQGLPWSVAVCAERVEQLCEFKRQLLKRGVPEESIGLWYSETMQASTDRTPNAESRQFLLLTHNRLRGAGETKAIRFHYQGQERNVVVWDESLIASNHTAFELSEFASAVHWLAERVQWVRIPKRKKVRAARADKATLEEFAHFLTTDCLPLLMQEHERQTAGQTPKPITLPAPPDEALPRWRATLRRLYKRKDAGNVQTIKKFLRIICEPIRLVTIGDTALVTFTVAVPSDLTRLVVLDASYPIRLLENMDAGLTYITDFENIKQWDQVTVTIDAGTSGRTAVTEDVRTRTESPTEWAVRTVKEEVSESELVLCITFKDRPGDVEDDEEDDFHFRYTRRHTSKERRLVEQFLEEAKAAGINPERFRFLTFGMETSTSDYTYIPNTLFLGLLHRSDVDLTGAYIGQSKDLMAPITRKDVRDAKLTEIAHHVYQGLSRGPSRIVENGQAHPQRIWLRYHQPHTLKAALAAVMPGAQWKLPALAAPRPAPVMDALVERIVDALNDAPETLLSRRKLKQRLDAQGTIPTITWRRAMTSALKSPRLKGDWQPINKGHSLQFVLFPEVVP